MQVLRSVRDVGVLCDECGERADVLLQVMRLWHPAVYICRGCLEQSVGWVADMETGRVRASENA